jgi:endonuclease/exonuclease/phosphatase family metal-dependent hydrolase
VLHFGDLKRRLRSLRGTATMGRERLVRTPRLWSAARESANLSAASPLRLHTPAQKRKPLHLLSYNVYFGFDGLAARQDPGLAFDQYQSTDAPARLRALACFLADRQPDAAGLQELVRLSVLDGAEPKVAADFLEVLASLLRERGGPEYQVHRQRGIHTAGTLPLSGDEPGTPFVFEEYNALLVHPRWQSREVGQWLYSDLVQASEGPEHHGVLHVRAQRDGMALELYNTHLEAFDAAVREAQARELLDYVARTSEPGLPAVLLGDMNARPGSAVHRAILQAGFVDTWAEAGRGSGSTCCQDTLLANGRSRASERIDYVFVRGGAARAAVEASRLVLNRRVPRWDGEGLLWPSDHFGVLSTVSFLAET